MYIKIFTCGILFFLGGASGRIVAQEAQRNVSLLPSNSCGLFSYRQIDIEHFLQSPVDQNQFQTFDEAVEMNLMLGNPTVNEKSNNIFLQITITSKPSNVGVDSRPLNVCLVLDRSASMQENNRMEKLKLALKGFCEIFRPNDYLSIVVYDDTPQVLYPAQKVYDKARVNTMIDGISMGSNTNLMAGLLAGYKELEKNYSSFCTNRLILMTDGMPNVGISSPKEIIDKSKYFNKKGVEVSTIGLGSDINFELLDQLATEGKGLPHFIGDCDSIQGDVSEALQDELESLLPVAKGMKLNISCPKNVRIAEVYGFKLTKNANKVDIDLHNVGQGQNKTILVRMEVVSSQKKGAIPLDVQLTYTNPINNRSKKLSRSIRSLYVNKSHNTLNLLSEREVRQNFTVAYVAEELKRALLVQATKNYSEARGIVSKCLKELSMEQDLPQTESFKQLHGMLQMQQAFLQDVIGK